MPIPSMYPRNIERGLSNRKGFCWVRPRAHARFLGPFFQLQKACERTHVGGGGSVKKVLFEISSNVCYIYLHLVDFDGKGR